MKAAKVSRYAIWTSTGLHTWHAVKTGNMKCPGISDVFVLDMDSDYWREDVVDLINLGWPIHRFREPSGDFVYVLPHMSNITPEIANDGARNCTYTVALGGKRANSLGGKG